MPDLNIFNLDFGNLAKLLNQGRIDKVYRKMWRVAENLAAKETRIFIYELPTKVKEFKEPVDVLAAVINFKKERVEFHMNEMKQLLDKSLKTRLKEK